MIGAGQSGGVVMHLADQATPQELRLKGSPSGKNYIGPAGPTPGEQDREIVSFDGRVLITRFIDKDAAVRYGNMVYVRCAPAGVSLIPVIASEAKQSRPRGNCAREYRIASPSLANDGEDDPKNKKRRHRCRRFV